MTRECGPGRERRSAAGGRGWERERGRAGPGAAARSISAGLGVGGGSGAFSWARHPCRAEGRAVQAGTNASWRGRRT